MAVGEVPPFDPDLDIIVERHDSSWIDIGIGLALFTLGLWLSLGL